MNKALEMEQPLLALENITAPAQVVEARKQLERGRRNSAWLQAHWSELLPHARGRHIAVAGQQAFIADSAPEAWAMAKTAHPDDDGAILQYVIPHDHPRIYANRR